MSSAVKDAVRPRNAPPDTAQLLAPTGLSLHPRRRRTIRVVVVTTMLLATYHLAMVFLAIAPPNILKDHAMKQVHWWIYPWFEQGWKMFAPEPVSTNRAFEVRVRNGERIGQWVNFTALDDAHIRGNPVTSREHANVVRRAWDGLQGLDLKKGPQSPAEEIKFIYTRNLVVSRMEHLGFKGFTKVQIRVRQQKVSPHNDMNKKMPWVTTNNLPWWKVPA